MRSVADRLREEDRQALARLSPTARVALALALGERDLELFRHARRPVLSRAEAARLLERGRQAGRRRARFLDERIG
jgi:hypothetical protein